MKMNYGDCFSVASEHNCLRIYVGENFVQTDVHSAL